MADDQDRPRPARKTAVIVDGGTDSDDAVILDGGGPSL